jgi:glutamine synthetase
MARVIRTTVAAMDTDGILAVVRDADVRLVRFLFCDLAGVIRAKAAHVDHLAARMTEGIGLARGSLALTMLDDLAPIPELTAVGEVRIVPDPTTCVVLPYVPGTASMLADLRTPDHQPWEVCPRTFLRRIAERYAERGLRVRAAIECEFFLARCVDSRVVPDDDGPIFSTIGFDEAAEVLDEIVQALTAQGLIVELVMTEGGHGQKEISIRHADPVRAADNHVRMRETIRGVARRHGLRASFAPKPFAAYHGSGAHLHLSMWDAAEERNLFAPPEGTGGLSPLGLQVTAGILAHLPAVVALTCPSVNSYRRLQPRSWASAYACYGPDNREAAVRIPSTFRGREEGSANLELKAMDSSCNPYLAIGAVLAAGLDGIERGLDPGAPVNGDPAALDEAERERGGIRRLPQSLEQALAALQRDRVLTDALGDVLSRSFIAIKCSEAAAFAAADPDVEMAGHMFKF